MDQKDILTAFVNAQDRRAAIHSLGKETGTDDETVIEILRDHGLCVKVANCRRCGRRFPMYLSPYCYECEPVIARRKELGKLNKAIIEFEIKRTATRKNELIREMIGLDLELERLKEELDG